MSPKLLLGGIPEIVSAWKNTPGSVSREEACLKLSSAAILTCLGCWGLVMCVCWPSKQYYHLHQSGDLTFLLFPFSIPPWSFLHFHLQLLRLITVVKPLLYSNKESALIPDGINTRLMPKKNLIFFFWWLGDSIMPEFFVSCLVLCICIPGTLRVIRPLICGY